MNEQASPTRVTAVQGDALPVADGRLSKQVLNTPSLEARWYRPPNPDSQSPHDRDEVYVVVTGQGEFIREKVRVKFSPGDLLFAARGESHHFEKNTRSPIFHCV